MIKNVIFDLGGVVLGRDFEQEGSGLELFDFIAGDRPFPQFWKDFDRGIITRSEVARAMALRSGCVEDEAHAAIRLVAEMFNEFPDSVDLVKELHERGYRLYVLSNMPLEFWEKMRELNVFRFFDGIVISSIEKMTKPDPAFFRLILHRYGLEPSQTLFVDDKPSNTSVAAQMGMHVCVFDPVSGPADVRRMLDKYR